MSTIHTTDPSGTPTLKDVWREMKARSLSYAKNFAVVGLIFSSVECNIESVRKTTFLHSLIVSTEREKTYFLFCLNIQFRAKSDIRNGTYAGFVTGGLLGFRGKVEA